MDSAGFKEAADGDGRFMAQFKRITLTHTSLSMLIAWEGRFVVSYLVVSGQGVLKLEGTVCSSIQIIIIVLYCTVIANQNRIRGALK